ncbi:MAG: phosphopantothenoylcysteine synthetase/decarboxylase [Myxococcota bacterium]|jgi:phosphopantothenoylcysteine synthetase/decarboxylase
MNVLVGVSGGIAAYKAADLVSNLVKRHSVRVVMTPSATAFVGPLTFEALSGHPVMVDVLATGGAPDGASAVEHISWAKWADIAVIAPLTASTLGKIASGIADNALLTVWLALPQSVPQLLCPAMNTRMWEHPAVQSNLSRVADFGIFQMVAPTEKRLACGDVGVGGLAEVADIVTAIEAADIERD